MSYTILDAYTKDIIELSNNVNTDLSHGLSYIEAKERLENFGTNTIKKKKKDSMTSKFLEQFKEPLIILLLISAFISILFGEIADSIGIFLAVTIVNFVGFYQEYKSEKSVEALQSLTAHTCKVVRNDKVLEIDANHLVIGDIVIVDVGDRIPADIRLFEARALELNESLFTGETKSAFKFETEELKDGIIIKMNTERLLDFHNVQPQDSNDGNNDYREKGRKKEDENQVASNMAYMGTTVVNGNGKGIVVATGDNTCLGKISLSLQDIKQKKTPLQKKMKEIGKNLSIFAFVIIAFIFVVGLFQKRNILEMFTVGVSLAVASIPEGLPIVVTVTLALGVTRMAKRNAIVKKLPAVEALGATTVICSDKTGTLTKNEMTVVKIFT